MKGVHWLEIHAVGGRDAGRIWPIEFGRHSIGAAPECRVRLSAPMVPDHGPVVSVDRFGLGWLTGLNTARFTWPYPAGDVLLGADGGAGHPSVSDEGAQHWPIGLDLVVGETLLRLVRRSDLSEAAHHLSHSPARVEPWIRPDLLAERADRCAAAPDAAQLGLWATGRHPRLWERQREGARFLRLRVGTADQPSLLTTDPPGRWTLPDVPVEVDLAEHGVIGVIGPDEDTAAVGRWLLSQTAVLHGPRTLRICMLSATAASPVSDRWAWVGGLPHAQPFGSGPAVTIGDRALTPTQQVGELLALIQARAQSSIDATLSGEPAVLVVMSGRLRDLPGVLEVLTDGPAVGVFSLCLDTDEPAMPGGCSGVILCRPDGLVIRQRDSSTMKRVRADRVSHEWCESVALSLSTQPDVTPDGPTRPPRPPAAEGGTVGTGRQSATEQPLLPPAELPDLAEMSHLFVIGPVGSDRSRTLLSLAGTAARATSSTDLHLYGIDATGDALTALSELPHCGAVVAGDDRERLGRLLSRLSIELAHRQTLLATHSAGDLTALRKLLPPEQRPPHLMVFVDGWEVLTAGRLDDGGRLQAALTDLLREGARAGMHLVATAERTSALGPDTQARLARPDTPSGPPPAAVLQAFRRPTAAVDPVTETLRVIGRKAQDRDQALLPGHRPFSVPALPSTITFADMFVETADADRRPLIGLIGLGGSGLSPITVDFRGPAQSFLVAGPPRSGRSNALATLAVSLLAGGTRLIVVTPGPSPLSRLAAHSEVALSEGDPAQISALLQARTGPMVVLLDDVDRLGPDNRLDPVLRNVVARGRERGIGLAVAGPADTIGQADGWLAQARQSQQAILLGPLSTAEGDLLGVRIPPNLPAHAVGPGRGQLVGRLPRGELEVVVIPVTELR